MRKGKTRMEYEILGFVLEEVLGFWQWWECGICETGLQMPRLTVVLMWGGEDGGKEDQGLRIRGGQGENGGRMEVGRKTQLR